MFLIKKFSKEIENLNKKITEMEERIKKLEWKEPISLEEFVKNNKYIKICDLDKLDYEWFKNKMIGIHIYNPKIFNYYLPDDGFIHISREKCVGYAYDKYQETIENKKSLEKLKKRKNLSTSDQNS